MSRSPEGCPLLQGVTLSADGTGWATGFRGEVYRRQRLTGRWERVVLGLPLELESLHAAWMDPEGGVWAVGGNVLSGGLNAGTLLHRGPAVATVPRGGSGPAPTPTCPAAAVDPRPGGSIARRWNEQILGAIRRDFPRPTVHARNLYHLSAAMWDAWAAYDATADGVFLREKHTAPDVAAARDGGAQLRRLPRAHAPLHARPLAGATSAACFRAFMEKLGYAPDATGTDGRRPARWATASPRPSSPRARTTAPTSSRTTRTPRASRR